MLINSRIWEREEREQTRDKNQEARTKNQEARIKNQESRIKNQEPTTNNWQTITDNKSQTPLTHIFTYSQIHPIANSLKPKDVWRFKEM